LITAGDFFLVTDFRYQEQVNLEAPWLKVNIRDGKMSEALGKTVQESKVARLGFEANFTPFGVVGALEKVLRESNARVELVPVEDVMVNIRKVKDDVEIDIIRQAVNVAEEAYQAVREQIKPGLTENYLAGLMGFELRCRGASDSSFPVIVAAGANSSLPHYRPGDVAVKRDQPLLIDWGAKFKGYCSDLTRTLMIGRVSPQLKKAYNIVLEAQKAAIEFLRPGVTTKQADTVARDVIEKAGYGDKFGHGLGHGIGRDIHELPTMRKIGGEEELLPGMVVTVEPGIYLPGEGGIRIEDDVLITHGGHEVLSSLDKSFEGCHIE
jgi:Xaa-Pro aminopeptidase/Xaa-Pro dipeptidase